MSLLFPYFVCAQETVQSAEVREAEKARLLLTSEIQLLAANLLDELVYSWLKNPPFQSPSPVVLMGVGVPLGMGSGLTTFLENHLFNLLIKNPAAQVKPAYCPECANLLFVAGKDGTFLAHGADFPEVLARARGNSGAGHALYLDFEAEGSSLVLRAKIVDLKGEPGVITAAFALSSSTSAGSLLRSPDRLRSVEDTRKEYVDILSGRSRFEFPVRIITRIFANPTGNVSSPQGGVPVTMPAVAPFIWLELGGEATFSQERLWMGGVSFGYTTLSEAHEGWSAGARLARLVSGDSRSFLHPDAYAFFGASVFNFSGTDATSFQKGQTPPPSEIIRLAQGAKPRASYGAFKFGLEAKIKNRFSASGFAETIPAFGNNYQFLGEYFSVGGFRFQCLGLEVGLWF
jgi:hypothetical protein